MGAAFHAVGDVMSRLTKRIAEIVDREFGSDPRGAGRAAMADLFNHLMMFMVGLVTLMLVMAASGGA